MSATRISSPFSTTPSPAHPNRVALLLSGNRAAPATDKIPGRRLAGDVRRIGGRTASLGRPTRRSDRAGQRESLRMDSRRSGGAPGPRRACGGPLGVIRPANRLANPRLRGAGRDRFRAPSRRAKLGRDDSGRRRSVPVDVAARRLHFAPDCLFNVRLALLQSARRIGRDRTGRRTRSRRPRRHPAR